MSEPLEHFADREFKCACGCGRGRRDMQPELLRRLVNARNLAGIPFVITSAVRCSTWNAKIGGVDSSAHVDGWAVDIAATNSSARFKIVAALAQAGFDRIGIAGTFIHADCDPRKPANVLWTY